MKSKVTFQKHSTQTGLFELQQLYHLDSDKILKQFDRKTLLFQKVHINRF